MDGESYKRAFDAIADMERAQSLAALQNSAKGAFERLGFDVFVGMKQKDAGGRLDVRVLFGQTNAAWEERYMAQRYQRHDAVLEISNRRARPFFWSETASIRPITPLEQRVFDEAAEFGLREGYLVPIHNPDGSVQAVLLAGKHIESQDPRLGALAEILALRFVREGLRLHGDIPRSPEIVLSARQMECLRWARDGKSAKDIGQIMGLSARTIETHIAEACRRLGVRTRMQAVVEAKDRGLIEI